MNKTFRNSKKALVPAIAVALLLAITIALVAAVGYAVSNVTPNQSSKTPTSTFDVTITKHAGSYFTGSFAIKQISGDAIDTANLKMKLTVNGETSEDLPNTNNTFYPSWGFPAQVTSLYGRDAIFVPGDDYTDGYVHVWYNINNDPGFSNIAKVRGFNSTGGNWVTATATSTTVDGSPGDTYRDFVLPSDNGEIYTVIELTSNAGVVHEFATIGWDDIELTNNDGIIFGMLEYNSPWLNVSGITPDSHTELRFGEYTLSPGQSARGIGTSNYPTPTDDIFSIIPTWASVQTGDVVNVLLVYTATNQVIWQGDVIVG
jgi:FlaG/FlaF family flagellin (archaellin)